MYIRCVPHNYSYLLCLSPHPKPSCRWCRWSTVPAIEDIKNNLVHHAYSEVCSLMKLFLTSVSWQIHVSMSLHRTYFICKKTEHGWIYTLTTSVHIIHARFSLLSLISDNISSSVLTCSQTININLHSKFRSLLTPDAASGVAISTAYILTAVYCVNLSFGEKNLSSKEGHLWRSALNERIARI